MENSDAWNNQYYFWGNGDGTLFYPGRPDKIGGTHHIPIESIRLKMIREGMEDYEYMKRLQQMGEETFAGRQVDRVISNAAGRWMSHMLVPLPAKSKQIKVKILLSRQLQNNRSQICRIGSKI